jgi:hypothetical protein
VATASHEVSELAPEEQDRIRATLPPGAPDFGEVTATYAQQNMMPAWAWFVITALLLAAAGALAGFGLSKAAADPNRMPILIIAALFGVGGASCAAAGLVVMVNPRSASPDQFVFCKGGLIHARAGKVTGCAWTDLEIRKARAHPMNRSYEISGHGGDPIVIGVPILGNKLLTALQDAQIRYARPEILRELEAGREVRFGQIAVCARGLVDETGVIPWASIRALNFAYDQLKTQQLFLSIETLGGTIHLNASKDLPNIWLFMEIVTELQPSLERFKTSQASWLR